jgi:hypothetical protein
VHHRGRHHDVAPLGIHVRDHRSTAGTDSTKLRFGRKHYGHIFILKFWRISLPKTAFLNLSQYYGQGDQVSLWKNLPKCSPTCICQRQYLIFLWKKTPTMWAPLVIFKKNPKKIITQ